MPKPHKCPICEGRGIDLYAQVTSSFCPTRENNPCHVCKGTGIIWDFDFNPVTPMAPPPWPVQWPPVGTPWPYMPEITWLTVTN